MQYTDQDLIAYLNRQLTAAESAALGNALRRDGDLRDRLKQIRATILVADMAELGDIRKQYPKTNYFPSTRSKAIYWWGAGLAMLMLVGYLMLGGGSGETPLPNEPIIPNTLPITPPEDTNMVMPPASPVTDTLRKEIPTLEQPPVITDPPAQPKHEKPVYASLAQRAYSYPSGGSIRTLTAEEDSLGLGKITELLIDKKGEETLPALEVIARQTSSSKVHDMLAHAYFQADRFTESTRLFNLQRKYAQGARKDELEWFWLLSVMAADNDLGPEGKALLEYITQPENYHNYEMPGKDLKNQLNL